MFSAYHVLGNSGRYYTLIISANAQNDLWNITTSTFSWGNWSLREGGELRLYVTERRFCLSALSKLFGIHWDSSFGKNDFMRSTSKVCWVVSCLLFLQIGYFHKWTNKHLTDVFMRFSVFGHLCNRDSFKHGFLFTRKVFIHGVLHESLLVS